MNFAFVSKVSMKAKKRVKDLYIGDPYPAL